MVARILRLKFDLYGSRAEDMTGIPESRANAPRRTAPFAVADGPEGVQSRDAIRFGVDWGYRSLAMSHVPPVQDLDLKFLDMPGIGQ